MPTVKEDLSSGHALRDIRGGSSITRTFEVTGLTALPHSQLIEAIQDPGIPKVDDQYPGGVALFVQEVTAEPSGGPNGATVQCVYSVPNRPQGGSWNQPFPAGRDGLDVKSVSWGTRELVTTRDRGNQPMELTVPATKSEWGQPYLTEAKILVPTGGLVFERVETAPPSDRLRALVGTLNDALIGGYAKNTLKFATFEAYSEDGGRTWNCTYTFEFDSNGWPHRDTWKDETGRPPPDAAVQTFDVLAETSFSSLGLDFTDTQTPL